MSAAVSTAAKATMGAIPKTHEVSRLMTRCFASSFFTSRKG
ncbi:MAG: hypothetical protein BWY66_01569 [bacterium ADurb.Bin374]|nr:MAG: hypothetical protein BWY66_01569 [bacterium ADurb.Bin374]